MTSRTIHHDNQKNSTNNAPNPVSATPGAISNPASPLNGIPVVLPSPPLAVGDALPAVGKAAPLVVGDAPLPRAEVDEGIVAPAPLPFVTLNHPPANTVKPVLWIAVCALKGFLDAPEVINAESAAWFPVVFTSIEMYLCDKGACAGGAGPRYAAIAAVALLGLVSAKI